MRTHHRIFQVLLVGIFLLSLNQWGLAGENRPDSPHAIVLPLPSMTFQPGQGSDIASIYCGICHSAEYVYMQPPHDENTWGAIVHKMKQAFGCPIPDDLIPPLVHYLVSQNDMALSESSPKEEPQETASSPTNGGDPAKGKTVYGTYCANCHGLTGKGDGPIGQSLLPPAANLTTSGNKSDTELLKTIQNGRPGTAMPSWKGDLSAQDILNVLSYIRTLSR